ncbi:hypothetical protein J6590_006273 [Homalodisca vitripennis]|nr:hypothetical protein J6590_006273 [Homalodisca vitripennis]
MTNEKLEDHARPLVKTEVNARVFDSFTKAFTKQNSEFESGTEFTFRWWVHG